MILINDLDMILILINGTRVEKDNVSRQGFLHFFQILIFRVNEGAKEQKMA